MNDTVQLNGSEVRIAEHSINRIFLDRWSPRSMSGEPIDDEDLMACFEAAKWAPSSYNNQPWRFLYARRDTANWPVFLSLMVEFNQSWTKNAGVLIVIISKTTFDHSNEPSRTHSFDTGAAWACLALEGARRGLVVHGMQGFDYDRAKRELEIPDGFEVHAMAAIGKPGRLADLPAELQKREKPNDRKKLAEIICEGKFKFPEKAIA